MQEGTANMSQKAKEQAARVVAVVEFIQAMKLSSEDIGGLIATLLVHEWLRMDGRFADFWLALQGTIFTSIAKINGFQAPEMSVLKLNNKEVQS